MNYQLANFIVVNISQGMGLQLMVSYWKDSFPPGQSHAEASHQQSL
ncbi:hypothetical protein IPW38_005006 [Escherichia coli]|nr:hypothetical protein [Escherichia coli]EJA4663976.1 hypothetical protein [Escherichia coli]EJH0011457.1 hypothetical protein [Escherichia coli]MCZ5666056.1 hypothetical protein [Escherichia coli]HBA4462777.1 hypothetical protein [Escherichia coli]